MSPRLVWILVALACALACDKTATLPLRALARDTLGLSADRTALLVALAMLAQTLRPLIGLGVDASARRGVDGRWWLRAAAVTATIAGFSSLAPDGSMTFVVPALGVAVGCAVIVDILSSTAIAAEQARGAQSKLLGALRSGVANGVLIGAGLGAAWVADRPLRRMGPVVAVLMVIAFVASFWMPAVAAVQTKTGPERPALSKAAVGAAVLGFVFYGVPGFATLLYIKQREQLHLSLFAVASLDSLNNVAALFGAVLYYRLRRRIPLRRMLPVGIVAYAIGSGSYLFYSSGLSAPPIEMVNGFLSALGLGAMWETAVRGAGDKGQAVSMALVLFASNVGISLSEVIGSGLSTAGMRLDQVIFLHVASYVLLALALTRAPAYLRELREEKAERGPTESAASREGA